MSASMNDWRAEDPEGSAPKVGGRPVHALWSLLRPSFRKVLLEPRRMAGSGTVGWRWQSDVSRSAPSAAELMELRKKLGEGLVSLSDDLERPGSYAAGVDPMELLTVMRGVIGELIQCSDSQLAAFVVSTEIGCLIRSWGFDRPAPAKSEAEEAKTSEVAAPPLNSQDTESTDNPTPAKRKRRRVLWVILIVILTAGAVAALLAGWRQTTLRLPGPVRHSEEPTTRSPSLSPPVNITPTTSADANSVWTAGKPNTPNTGMVSQPAKRTPAGKQGTPLAPDVVPTAIGGATSSYPGENEDAVIIGERPAGTPAAGLAVALPSGGGGAAPPLPPPALGKSDEATSPQNPKKKAGETGITAGGGDAASLAKNGHTPPSLEIKKSDPTPPRKSKTSHGEVKAEPDRAEQPPTPEAKRELESDGVHLTDTGNIASQSPTESMAHTEPTRIAPSLMAVSSENPDASAEEIAATEINAVLPMVNTEPRSDRVVVVQDAHEAGPPRTEKTEATVTWKGWISGSRLRQLTDVVLPTLPTEQTGREALAVARRAARERMRAASPAAFRSPTVRVGWRLQLTPAVSQWAPPQWRDANTGQAPDGEIVIEVNPGDTRLSWPENRLNRSMDLRLMGGDGRQVARVQVSGELREVEISAGDEVRSVAPWLMVARNGADAAPGTLVWRNMKPAEPESLWEISEDARETSVAGKAQPKGTGPRDYEVALVHPSSGQALSWEIRER